MPVSHAERKELIEKRWELLRKEESAKGNEKVELRTEIDRLSVLIQEHMLFSRSQIIGSGSLLGLSKQ